MGFFETRKSNLEVLWQEQPEEPLRPSSQRDFYWREHKNCVRENTNTEVALARTEHETDHHKKKVPSVFCITKYQTSFLRAHAPYRREGNKGALPASESSLFPVWEMTQKTQRELGLVPLLHLTWSQPLEQENRFDWQELRFKTCPPHLQHIKINQQLSCRPCILQNTCNKSNNSSLYKPSIPICACYRLHSSTSSKPLACSNAPFHAFWKQVSGNTPTIRFYHLSFYTNTRETGQNPFYWKHIC